jgi:hypothetical protein
MDKKDLILQTQQKLLVEANALIQQQHVIIEKIEQENKSLKEQIEDIKTILEIINQ